MTTETKKTEKCFWCGKEFEPTSHNLVHVGGHGDVYGCNECLGFEEAETET